MGREGAEKETRGRGEEREGFRGERERIGREGAERETREGRGLKRVGNGEGERRRTSGASQAPFSASPWTTPSAPGQQSRSASWASVSWPCT